MTKEFFEEVMRVPTVSHHEDMMQEFLLEWASKHKCKAKKDAKGNVYLTKGHAKGFYPCLANHIDTVHDDQKEMVEQKVFKEIVWKGDKVEAVNPITQKQTGLGMDDQGGCAIALAVIDRLPAAKGIFVVEEEVGMTGSAQADKSFFDDCAFIISNDSPDRNRATHYSSGVQLYSDQFFEKYLEPICKKHGVTRFNSEPYTDVKRYRQEWKNKDSKHIECFNFGNGGYAAHLDTEYAQFSDVNAAEDLLYALCTEIPTDVQHVSDVKEEPRPTYSWSGYSGGSYAGSDWWKQWLNGGRAQQATFDFDKEEETGYFDWNFRDPDAAQLAVARLPKLLSDVKTEKKGGNLVRVSGPKSKLRTAFRFSYNYDNKDQPGVPYKYDTAFYRDVVGASQAFQKKYVQDVKPNSDDEKNPDSPCAITLYFADSDVMTGFVEALNEKKNPVEVDDDGYSTCTVAGRLEDVQSAYVEYVNADTGGKRKFDKFDQLSNSDKKAFWEDVEFAETDMDDDSINADDVIDAEYTMIDADRGLEPESNADDIWDWWKQSDDDSSDDMHGHEKDEECSINLVFHTQDHFKKFEQNAEDIHVGLDKLGPLMYIVSGKLEDVMRALVAYINSKNGSNASYKDFDSIPPYQKKQFWEEVKFGKKEPGKKAAGDGYRGRSPDEKCSLEFQIPGNGKPEFKDDFVKFAAVHDLTAAETENKVTVSGKLKDVLSVVVDYMNLWKGYKIYDAISDVPQTQLDAVWKELEFEK